MTYSRGRRSSSDEIAPKPYELIPFPKTPPLLTKPNGHHQYRDDRQHGSLTLMLNVQTPLHVSTGVIAMGADVEQTVPLIKTMPETDESLVIQVLQRSLDVQDARALDCSARVGLNRERTARLNGDTSSLERQRPRCLYRHARGGLDRHAAL